MNVGAPVPTNYTPLVDFFPIFDMAMTIPDDFTADDTVLGWLNWIASQALSDTLYDGQLLLSQLLAVPVALFNNPYWDKTFPNENQHSTGYLAFSTYRVCSVHY